MQSVYRHKKLLLHRRFQEPPQKKYFRFKEDIGIMMLKEFLMFVSFQL